MNRLLFALLFLTAIACSADDWPQWRGPNRDGISHETGLMIKWPEDGPRLVWKAKGAGVGYSTPSIANGRMFLMGDHGEDQFVICYDERTGEEIWSKKIGPQYIDAAPFTHLGARCTPTVDGDRVYALGTNGDLVCFRAKDGSRVWGLNILKEFKGNSIEWGISESPLVESNMVVVMAGGHHATLVALDKLTGETIWTSHNPEREQLEPASFASMVAADIDGERQIIAVTHIGGFGARVKDGTFLWNFPMGGTASNTTPIVHENKVFISGQYGPGCCLLDVARDAAERRIYLNRNLRNLTGGAVLIDGYLYGHSSKTFVCMKFETGEIAWHKRTGDVSVSVADGLLYLRGINDPHNRLVQPDPAQYREISTFAAPKISKERNYPHPVIANGHLLLRDVDLVRRYDIRRK